MIQSTNTGYKARHFLTGQIVTATSLEKLGKLINSSTAVTLKRAMRNNILTPAGWQVLRKPQKWLPVTIDASTVVRCGSWVVKSDKLDRLPITAKTLDELVIKINLAYPNEFITERVLSHRFGNGSATRTGWTVTATWGTHIVRQRKRFEEMVLESPKQPTHGTRNTGKAFMMALEHLLTH